MSDGLLKRAMDKLKGRGKQIDSAVSKATGRKKNKETEAERRKRLAKEKRDKKIAADIRARRNKRKNAPQL